MPQNSINKVQHSTWRSVWFLDRGIALSPGPHVPWSTPATPQSHAPLLSLSQPWSPCSVVNTCDTTITCIFTVSVLALVPMFCDQHLWHHNNMHLYCLFLCHETHMEWVLCGCNCYNLVNYYLNSQSTTQGQLRTNATLSVHTSKLLSYTCM